MAPAMARWALFCGLWAVRARPVAERLSGCGDGALGPDLASYWLVSTWHGHANRTDLSELREFNVRPLLLHHCVVHGNVADFLDEAWMTGLRVVVELQPLLFVEPSVGCFMTNFDCYQRIKVAYRQLLSQSGIWSDGEYHPAVQALLLARDPVALASAVLGEGDVRSAQAALLGVVSAWDGVLGAEMDLGVARPVPLDITVLLPMALPAAAQTSTDACFRKKASQGGCAGPHSLRAMYMTAWQVPGYQRTLDLPDLTRRGFWPPPDPPIEEAVYVPHNDVFSSFLSRWVQMFPGSPSLAEIVNYLRQFQEFLPNEYASSGGKYSSLVELNNTPV
ncbi:unnamed protein product [Effrenium voratum]|uniref:Uncharacterized protein n=1 Tax=Effrenium voratum TaxID=2562239 RepID=A0AA36JQ31_9DINO|nr:unnamed protein product [Effrenium voratum]CAJ1442360.1 unnamed protein product [Effrenium voratum]